MLFAVICHDKADALQLRLATREAHLAYVASTGVVTLAGPFLDPEGRMTGSLIVLDVENLQAAEAWADADPYARAGLFDRATISAWKRVIG